MRKDIDEEGTEHWYIDEEGTEHWYIDEGKDILNIGI